MNRREHGWSRASRVWMSLTALLGASAVFFGLAAGGSASAATEPVTAVSLADAKYIGAAKCKSCHSGEEKGDQYGIWEKGAHAKAFETLASEEAKALAAKQDIADPQKADECLQCHVTAFGVDEGMIKRGFKQELGVQCESCHGPGEAHMKARFTAASAPEPVPIGADEFVHEADVANCLQCHNEKSPTYQKFCYYERVEQIRHSLPGADKGAELVCGCGDSCPCDHGNEEGCPVPRSQLGK